MTLHNLRAILLTLTAVALWGCATQSPRIGTSSRRTGMHLMREIRLTPASPADKSLGIRLVSVDPDGAVLISVHNTREILKAAPGEPFLGKRDPKYGVRTFGERGLILRNSDVTTQSAVLEHHWREHRWVTHTGEVATAPIAAPSTSPSSSTSERHAIDVDADSPGVGTNQSP
jgi:hypothetical protein